MPVEELTEDEWEKRWFNQAVQAARPDHDPDRDNQDPDRDNHDPDLDDELLLLI